MKEKVQLSNKFTISKPDKDTGLNEKNDNEKNTISQVQESQSELDSLNSTQNIQQQQSSNLLMMMIKRQNNLMEATKEKEVAQVKPGEDEYDDEDDSSSEASDSDDYD